MGNSVLKESLFELHKVLLGRSENLLFGPPVHRPIAADRHGDHEENENTPMLADGRSVLKWNG